MFIFLHKMRNFACKKLTKRPEVLYNEHEERWGENMAYDVLDVSRYIINYSNSNNYKISNLKLQKLLYFVQAYFLLEHEGNVCFDDRIEAWDFGPVVPKAYHEYKMFGSLNIPTVTSYIDFNSEDIWKSGVIEYNENVILKKDREDIASVIEEFSDYSASYLVSLTHRQKPWRDAYNTLGQNSVIEPEAIRRYFSEQES